MACFHGSCNGKAHANTHHTPRAHIKALTWFVDIDDRTGEIERISTLIHKDRVWSLFHNFAQTTKRTMEIHWHIVVHQFRLHTSNISRHLFADGIGPLLWRLFPVTAHLIFKG